MLIECSACSPTLRRSRTVYTLCHYGIALPLLPLLLLLLLLPGANITTPRMTRPPMDGMIDFAHDQCLCRLPDFYRSFVSHSHRASCLRFHPRSLLLHLLLHYLHYRLYYHRNTCVWPSRIDIFEKRNGNSSKICIITSNQKFASSLQIDWGLIHCSEVMNHPT